MSNFPVRDETFSFLFWFSILWFCFQAKSENLIEADCDEGKSVMTIRQYQVRRFLVTVKLSLLLSRCSSYHCMEVMVRLLGDNQPGSRCLGVKVYRIENHSTRAVPAVQSLQWRCLPCGDWLIFDIECWRTEPNFSVILTKVTTSYFINFSTYQMKLCGHLGFEFGALEVVWLHLLLLSLYLLPNQVSPKWSIAPPQKRSSLLPFLCLQINLEYRSFSPKPLVCDFWSQWNNIPNH